MTGPIQIRRCAIYTRVSTEHGLEQEFNSLQAQREAAQAYIKSQAHDGWKLVRDHYDDGGFSGGSVERPALQQLLRDIRDRKIDIVVVYKVDRLTRSLTDFARLVEEFDGFGVSFVSVTQAFNTTTSMGRLTLNVLLSFAQFEREVTGERIRDKIAASKKKGIWMGGGVPLGYRVENRALHIVDEHAALIRRLFQRYLQLGSAVKLLAALREEGTIVPVRSNLSGKRVGGGPFTRGHLYTILSNPIYIGAIRHRRLVHGGQHPPILEQEVWDQVQQRLADRRRAASTRRDASQALLLGKLRDGEGRTLTPSYTGKNGRRYRYYVSSALLTGETLEVDAIRRLPAAEVECAVTAALRQRDVGAVSADEVLSDRDLIRENVEMVTVHRDHIAVRLKIPGGSEAEGGEQECHAAAVIVPWSKQCLRRHKTILAPHDEHSVSRLDTKSRAKLVMAIAQAHRWVNAIIENGATTTTSIAVEKGISERLARQHLSLAFLAPDLVQAAIDNRLPRGFGVTRLFDLPLSWAKQREQLGLSDSA